MKRIFADVKEDFIKDNKNFYYKVPYMQLATYRTSLLINYLHTPDQMLGTDLSFEQFCEMDRNNLNSGKFEWFITGNLTPEEAVKLTKHPEEVFKSTTTGKFQILTHSDDLVHIKPVELEKNTTMNYVIHAKDVENLNSCVLSYFQKEEETMRSKLLNEVVFQYLNEPTFDQLRTKEQLGYIASSFNIPLRLIDGGGFIIQSAVGSPEFLISRINALLDTHREEVHKVSDEYFDQMVDSIRNRKKQKDLSLREETRRLNYEIVTHQYEFDRKTKEIELLSSLAKTEFIDYFHDLFYNEPKRLNIQLLAAQHIDNQQEFHKLNEDYCRSKGIKNVYIDTIEEYKAHSKFYPDLYKVGEKIKAKI